MTFTATINYDARFNPRPQHAFHSLFPELRSFLRCHDIDKGPQWGPIALATSYSFAR
jgi:hypothetical protein